MSDNKNPWLSFRQYGEEDAPRFKGRDTDIENLFRLVEGSDITVLYAGSGIGKSSLVDAGLIPQLRGNLYLPIHFILPEKKPEGDPFDYFESIILQQIQSEIKTQNEDLPETAWYLMRPSDPALPSTSLLERSLWWKLRTCPITSLGLPIIPVLIFDQFEEVFKLPSASTEAFFSLIQELSLTRLPDRIREELLREDVPLEKIPDSPYKMLFSLREEYIGSLDYWGIQRFNVTALKNNRYSLRPLNPDQAREVIMDQGVDTLNLIADKIIEQSRESGKEHISTLILSVLCSKLYEMADIDESGNKIPLSEDQMPESTVELIGQHYDQMIEEIKIPPRIRKVIETELVSESGKRVRLPVDTPSLERIFFASDWQEEMDKKHLVRISEINGVKYVELVHDKVAEVIAERNRSVRTNTRRRRSLFLATLLSLAIILVSGFFFIRGAGKVDYSPKYGREVIAGRTPTTVELDHPADFKNCPDLLKVIVTDWDADDETGPSFTNCPHLAEIILPEGIKKMGYIENCPGLKKIVIPSTLWDGSYVFDNLNEGIDFVVSPANTRFRVIDDVLWESDYFKEKTRILYVKSTDEKQEGATLFYTVFPDKIKDSSKVVFNGNIYNNSRLEQNRFVFSDGGRSLDKVRFVPDAVLDFRIPPLNSITKIYPYAVDGRDELRELILSDGIRIGSNSFRNCRNLRSVAFGKDTQIGCEAFFQCPSIDSLDLRNVIEIGGDAFRECGGIQYLQLPDTVSLAGKITSNEDYLLHCDVAFNDDSSIYERRSGLIWDTKANEPVLVETDYHIYQDDSFRSIEGVLMKETSDGLRIYDFPSGANWEEWVKSMRRNGELQDISMYQYTKRPISNFIHAPFSPLFVGDGNSDKTSVDLYQWFKVGYFFVRKAPFSKVKEIHCRVVPLGDSLSDMIPEERMNNVTLYVPRHQFELAVSNPELSRFKSIEVEPFVTYCLRVSRAAFINSIPVIANSGIIFYPLFFFLLAFIAFILYVNAKTNRDFWRSALYTILHLFIAFLVWFFLYWAVYLWLPGNSEGLKVLYANLIAVPVAIGVFLLCLNTIIPSWRILWRNIKQSVTQAPRSKAFIPVVASCILGLLLIGVIQYRQAREPSHHKQLQKAIYLFKSHDYDGAAETVYAIIPKSGRISSRDTTLQQARILFQHALNELRGSAYSFHTYASELNVSERYVQVYRGDSYILLDARTLDSVSVSTERFLLSPDNGFLIRSVDGHNVECLDMSLKSISRFNTRNYSSIKLSPDGKYLLNPINPRGFEIRDSHFEVIDTLNCFYSDAKISPGGHFFAHPTDFDFGRTEVFDSQWKRLGVIDNCYLGRISFPQDDRYLIHQLDDTQGHSRWVFRDQSLAVIDTLQGYDLILGPTGNHYVVRVDKNSHPTFVIVNNDLSPVDTLTGWDNSSIRFSPDGNWLVCRNVFDTLSFYDNQLVLNKVLQSTVMPVFCEDGQSFWLFDSLNEKISIYDSYLEYLNQIRYKPFYETSILSNGEYYLVRRDRGYKNMAILDKQFQKIGECDSGRYSCFSLNSKYLNVDKDNILLLLSPTRKQWKRIQKDYQEYLDSQEGNHS